MAPAQRDAAAAARLVRGCRRELIIVTDRLDAAWLNAEATAGALAGVPERVHVVIYVTGAAGDAGFSARLDAVVDARGWSVWRAPGAGRSRLVADRRRVWPQGRPDGLSALLDHVTRYERSGAHG